MNNCTDLRALSHKRLIEIINNKDKIIDELLKENAKYRKMYWEDRARQDEGE